MPRPLVSLAMLMILAVTALLTPVGVAAGGGPAPTESCVPGTVWEDTTSGVKYICIYDELYGGTRWELLSSGQRGDDGWMYRSSSLGCVAIAIGLSGSSGGGADAIARSYRWPCQRGSDRLTQPAGELRARIVVQVHDGAWATCRDSGYLYNTSTTSGWLAGLDMGAAADCGSGTYRAVGFGAFLQGGAWRGGTLVSPSLFIR